MSKLKIVNKVSRALSKAHFKFQKHSPEILTGIGIAGGDGWGMIFEKGEQVEKLPFEELLPALLKRIENF